MRDILLATVAAAALILGAAGAYSQAVDQNSQNTGAMHHEGSGRMTTQTRPESGAARHEGRSVSSPDMKAQESSGQHNGAMRHEGRSEGDAKSNQAEQNKGMPGMEGRSAQERSSRRGGTAQHEGRSAQEGSQERKGASQQPQGEARHRGASSKSVEQHPTSNAGASQENRDQRTGQAQQRSNAQSQSTAQGKNTNQEPNKATQTGSSEHQGAEHRNASSGAQNNRSGTNNGATNAAENKPANQPNVARDQAHGNGESQNEGRSVARGETNTNVNVHGQINLNPQQASRVHETLLKSGARAETDVNFSVDVGASVPPRVHLRPLPRSVVEVSPQFRHDEYVIVHDQIVIVEPRTKRVVEIIGSASGDRGTASSGRAHHRSLSLTESQRKTIRHDILERRPRTAEVDVGVGQAIPGAVTVEPLPREIFAEVPSVESYDYVVTPDDHILLIDPQTRDVVDVID